MRPYDPLEDENLGQPPLSVAPNDPRAGLYAYLAQQAAVRAGGQTVPSYQEIQRQATGNADRSAANAFGAALQNSASMAGQLNGKRSDYSGPADFAKSLDNSGQEELAGNYQALSQRNKDVATEGQIYKDLSNPDLARQKLYSALLEKQNIENGRNNRAADANEMKKTVAEIMANSRGTIADGRNQTALSVADKNNAGRMGVANANNQTRRDIADADRPIKQQRADTYEYRFGEGAPDKDSPESHSYTPVYPKDGADPYMLDRKTGKMTPLPKGFNAKNDLGKGFDAAGNPIDPDADEPIRNKDDMRDYNKLLKDTNPALASSRSDFGKNQATVNAAKRLEPLYEQGLNEKAGLNPTQMREIATAAAALIGGGSATAQSQVEHMTPQSVGKSQAEIFQWLSNEPKGANQMAFAKQLMDTARREGHLAQQNLNTSITSTYNTSPLQDRYPNRMSHSYYNKVGDDAAYDEQGRYIAEPYVEGKGNLQSVGQSPIQLQAPAQKSPGGGYGPSADAGQYQQDMADAAWGKAHGLTFEQAKAIRDKRRAASGQ